MSALTVTFEVDTAKLAERLKDGTGRLETISGLIFATMLKGKPTPYTTRVMESYGVRLTELLDTSPPEGAA